MLYQTTVLFAALATIGVLPSTPPPPTDRLSRGPEQVRLQDLRIDSQTMAQAKQLRRRSRRIAVVTPHESEQPSVGNPEVVAEIIRTGLLYGDKLIVIDEPVSRQLFSTGSDTAAIREAAAQHDVDMVVLVQLDASREKVLLKLLLPSSDFASEPDPIAVENRDEAVVGAAVSAREPVLRAVGAFPTQHADQLRPGPKADLPSIKQHIEATQLYHKAAASAETSEAAQRYTEAIEAADRAIEASPAYLSAHLVKASCQYKLGRMEELRRTLTSAYQKIDPTAHDRLVRLELQGDYARLVEAHPVEALEAYLQILETDPDNLIGLWSTIHVLLGGEGSQGDGETIAKASELAAQLVVFHPQTAVAEAIGRQDR